MASSPQQHAFGFQGNIQREAFMWLPVNFPSRQPVMLAVVVGDAFNATDIGMMTWYDIRLIICKLVSAPISGLALVSG